jgi:hypothetical protein
MIGVGRESHGCLIARCMGRRGVAGYWRGSWGGLVDYLTQSAQRQSQRSAEARFSLFSRGVGARVAEG